MTKKQKAFYDYLQKLKKGDIAYYVYNYNCWCVELSGEKIDPPIAWCEIPKFKEM